ncbi:MAG: 30S ribosomal protein S9 [Candidatus Margulisbacteria bacterium]|nr:30S ribosomal protein S9 [Candidatus Margulisiibacteriota bacterium]
MKKEPRVKAPKEPQFYGTGRRKEAIAKVRLQKGTGEILVNGRSFADYFCHRKSLEFQVARPLHTAEVRQNYNVAAETFGGGIASQADAVSLGIARALLQVNPDFRSKLKKVGLLSRDPRVKERKKYGLKRARRAFQYTKR